MKSPCLLVKFQCLLVWWVQFKGSLVTQKRRLRPPGAVPALKAFDALAHHLSQTPETRTCEHCSIPSLVGGFTSSEKC